VEMMRYSDIYRQLYEESLDKRRAQKEEIMWYKQRAREAERKWRRLAHVGLGLLTAVNMAAWILAFTIGR